MAYMNRDSVLQETGLFRIPGDVAAIRRLRAGFVRGDCRSIVSSRIVRKFNHNV